MQLDGRSSNKGEEASEKINKVIQGPSSIQYWRKKLESMIHSPYHEEQNKEVIIWSKLRNLKNKFYWYKI